MEALNARKGWNIRFVSNGPDVHEEKIFSKKGGTPFVGFLGSDGEVYRVRNNGRPKPEPKAYYWTDKP